MSKELTNLVDYAGAAEQIVDDLLAQGFLDGEILDLLDFIKQAINLRCHIRADNKNK